MSGASRSSSSPTLPATAVLPFTLEVHDESVNSDAGARRSFPATSRRCRRASLGAGAAVLRITATPRLHGTKEFSLDPANVRAHASARAVARDGRRCNPTIVWGPALGDIDSSSGRYAREGARPSLRPRATSRAFAPAKIADAADARRRFPYAGIDDHYFMTRGR